MEQKMTINCLNLPMMMKKMMLMRLAKVSFVSDEVEPAAEMVFVVVE
jgi:hypothetical protein